ncbi:MAG TPA: tetratricopeptide repeat protein [Candidatus Angelobacter sp.]|jgi:tetratricopeptide (TPR) repeat protein|nr:tetratricopeptide repeat protein [Candidatus Angelobacter sp.]
MKPWSIAICLSALFLMQDVRLADCHGEVRDMQGRPIAGALVVYTLKDTGKTYSIKTDTNGQYHIIGLKLGIYDLEITGPTGKHIYSGKRFLSAGDAQKFNVVQVDLSIVPPKASLVPFKGPRADEMKGAREQAFADGKKISSSELAELRADNALISRYNEMVPDIQEAIKAQDWKRGEELLHQLLEIAPYKWELYQNLGTIQRNLGRHSDAVSSFEKGIQVLRETTAEKPERINPSIAQMQISEGEALVALDKPEEATTAFRSAAQLDPKPALAYLHLCSAEYNSGHPDEASSACSRAIAVEPARAESYQLLASIQSNLDHPQEAVRTYEKGIAVALENMRADRPSLRSNINSKHLSDPSFAIGNAVRAGQMMQSAGNIYFLLKNFSKAADLFTQSARFHPYPALPLFNLCATLFDMEKFSAAATACDRAIEADPKVPDPYYVKAAALAGDAAKHHKAKSSHETTAALQEYLQLAPQGFYANDARALLKEITAAK